MDPAGFRVRSLGFGVPVLCPRNRLQAADSRGRGKLRPYQVLHDTKKQASLCHRIDAKQADRTEVASDEPAKPSSSAAFGPFRPCEKTGRGKPRPYQVLHDTKKQASLSHRIDGKQSDRTEVTSGEPVKPSSRLRLVRFAHARKPGGASPAPTRANTDSYCTTASPSGDEPISVRRDSGGGNSIFPNARKPGGASPAPTTRTVFRGMSKPRPYDAEHDV